MSRINIGFMDNNRSSTRALKPPGGGLSDIFCTNECVSEKSKAREVKTVKIEEIDTNNQNGKNSPVNPQDGLETKVEQLHIITEEKNEVDNGAPGRANGNLNKISEIRENKEITTEAGNKSTISSTKTEIREVKSTSSVSSIIHGSTEKNENRPTRGKVPPGGYSSGFW